MTATSTVVTYHQIGLQKSALIPPDVASMRKKNTNSMKHVQLRLKIQELLEFLEKLSIFLKNIDNG